MSSNLSDINEAVENLNVTFDAINVENILPIAIDSSNQSTNGWVGITVLIIFSSIVIIHLLKNKGDFQLSNQINVYLISLSVILDMGIQLLLFRILESIQIFIFIYVTYFVVCSISFLKKEMNSIDT